MHAYCDEIDDMINKYKIEVQLPASIIVYHLTSATPS